MRHKKRYELERMFSARSAHKLCTDGVDGFFVSFFFAKQRRQQQSCLARSTLSLCARTFRAQSNNAKNVFYEQ